MIVSVEQVVVRRTVAEVLVTPNVSRVHDSDMIMFHHNGAESFLISR